MSINPYWVGKAKSDGIVHIWSEDQPWGPWPLGSGYHRHDRPPAACGEEGLDAFVEFPWDRYPALTIQSTEEEIVRVLMNNTEICYPCQKTLRREALTMIPGINEDKANKLRVDGGYGCQSDLQKASQKELSNVDGIGNALAARIKAHVADKALGVILGSTSGIEAGDPVVDKENVVWGIATEEPRSRADEVEVEPGVTVAQWEGNEDYPDDDPVVDVHFPGYVRKEYIEKGRVKLFSYPASRLVKMEVDVGRREMSATVDVIDGLGACGHCGCAITSEMESYIDGPEGKFCNIDCYNAALQP